MLVVSDEMGEKRKGGENENEKNQRKKERLTAKGE